MARTVICIKLGKEAEGLDFAPYPGELGKRIWESVSKEAWAAWLKHQTMLVNENRLNLADARARQYLCPPDGKPLLRRRCRRCTRLRSPQRLTGSPRCRCTPQRLRCFKPVACPPHGRSRRAWSVLDTSFGAGHRFMATWLAWQADPQRPTMLHYVGHISLEDYEQYFSKPSLSTSDDYQALHKAASDRARGIHRLLLEKGQISLTLCIGDSKAFFADHHLFADTLWVDALHLGWDKWTAKALARLCSRGATSIADLPEGPNTAWLQEAGFVQIAATPTSNALRATFDPPWKLGAKEPPVAKSRSSSTSHCCVVGAGISGSSVAYALARRGWRVTVLDKAAHPGSRCIGPTRRFGRASHLSG